MAPVPRPGTQREGTVVVVREYEMPLGSYCTFGNCKLVFFRPCVDRYGGALVVLGMSGNPEKPSFRSPNGLLAPFLA
jgi:hypothetical protein